MLAAALGGSAVAQAGAAAALADLRAVARSSLALRRVIMMMILILVPVTAPLGSAARFRLLPAAR